MNRNIKRIVIAAPCVIVFAVVIYFSYPRSAHAKGVEASGRDHAEVRDRPRRRRGRAHWFSPLRVQRRRGGALWLHDGEGRGLRPRSRCPGAVDLHGTREGPHQRRDLRRLARADDGRHADRRSRASSQRLLGTVERKGIGEQVTYAGHPLYLFDPSSAPFRPLGVDYVETVEPLAPWHGYWFLVSSANGDPVAGLVSLTRATLPEGSRVLAVTGDPNINPFAVVVYTDSRDRRNVSTCTGACCAHVGARLDDRRAESGLGSVTERHRHVPASQRHPSGHLWRQALVFLLARAHRRDTEEGIETGGTAGNGNRSVGSVRWPFLRGSSRKH